MKKTGYCLLTGLIFVILFSVWNPAYMVGLARNGRRMIGGSVRDHYFKSMVRGERLILGCSNCDVEIYNHFAEIEIEDPQIKCDGKLHGVTVKAEKWGKTNTTVDSSWREVYGDINVVRYGGDPYVVLYEGVGKTTYPLTTEEPTEEGYYAASLVLQADWENWDGTSTLNRTTPKEFHAVHSNGHEWTYTTEEFSICADCSLCGIHAAVKIDTSGVYEASRTYDGGELEYEVFYEENWSNQEGIEPYYVLYDGYETISSTESTVYDRAYVRPMTTGNYTVRISLLKDADNPNTAWLSTKSKSYYLADITVNDCTLLNYGNTEKSQFTQPEQQDGYYQVGTLSELLWCVYYGGNDCNVALTNDIVVNPITVTNDGRVRSAKYQLYNWQGFGTKDSPFRGDIQGNGWTIYGIYHPKNDGQYAGLINYGEDVNISALTVENAMIQDVDSGTFMGRFNCRTGTSLMENCNALNCYIVGTNCHGGMIGWFTNDGNQTGEKIGKLSIKNSANDSYIKGKWAGGIIGKAVNVKAIMISYCHNGGEINGDEDGGGIIGYLEIPNGSSPVLGISFTTNIGKISGGDVAGGIVGRITKQTALEISRCTSIGYINVSAQKQGGIIGYCESGSPFSVVPNYYYDASSAYGNKEITVLLKAEKLTKQEIKEGFLCSTYGHRAASHWSNVSYPSCERAGSMKLVCQLCNQVLETQSLPKRSHYYEYGQCIYCGAYEDEEDELLASVFSEEPRLIVVSILAVILAVGGTACLIWKKKKAQ